MKKQLAILAGLIAAVAVAVTSWARHETAKAQRVADACLAEQVTVCHRLLNATGRATPSVATEVIAEAMRAPIRLNGLEWQMVRGPKNPERIRWTGNSFVPVDGPTFDELRATGTLEAAPSELRRDILSVQNLREFAAMAPART